MFDSLANALGNAYRAIVGNKVLTEQNVEDGIRAVRQALLEADVNFQVAKQFIADVKQRALGQDVIKAVDPGQQFVKVFHDALTELLGGERVGLPIADAPPLVLMMCGLQGSGKTTTCGKLALWLRKNKKKNPLLVAADLQRPAAVEQLQALGKQLGIAVYAEPTTARPPEVCRRGIEHGKKHGHDVIILDTAGRLHVDEPLMLELKEVHDKCKPHGVLLVCDAMLGQDAVNSAKAFHDRLPLHGLLLTKVDGDARGGAALSIVKVTGRPILFAGVGEKPEDLEEFDPPRMAGRILGMGDVVALVEKAREEVSDEEAEKMAEKLSKGQLTMDDFLSQMKSLRRMGPMKQLLGMLPGVGSALKDVNIDDKQFDRLEGMVHSMTAAERKNLKLFNKGRVRRIAQGSGTTPNEVNRLTTQFEMVQKMTASLASGGMAGRMQAAREMAKSGGMPGMPGMPALPGLGSKGSSATVSPKAKFKQRKK